MICGGIGIISIMVHKVFPPAGSAVTAMFFGMILRLIIRIPESWKAGMKFTAKKLLKISIILLGGSLSLRQLLSAGSSSLIVMIFTLSSAFLAAWLFGKYLFGISFNQRNLIAVGTGICGGSAIAALSPVLEADETDTAFAVSATFLFDVAAVLIFPVAGIALGMTDIGYGLWAGTAVNDTSSVVAAGYAFSDQAGEYAAMVKMARTTMILPLGIILNFVMRIRNGRGQAGRGSKFNFKSLIPWFVLAFAGVVVLNTLFPFPPAVSAGMKRISSFIITMALSAIGLNTDLAYLLRNGKNALLLGGLVSLTVVFVSLGVQLVMGVF